MCYLVTWMSGGVAGRADRSEIFDTEEAAKGKAEALVLTGASEVTIWKQFAVPKVERTVTW